MKTITAFCGSPRAGGISKQLLDQALKGARENGAEVYFYDLNASGIRGCQHCRYCRSHEGCALQDPLAPMYRQIAQADAVLLATPIYFHHISGQTKLWLDRLYPMFDTPSYQCRYPGKKAGTIFTQGFEDPDRYRSVIDGINGIFEKWQWRVAGSLLSTGNPVAEGKSCPTERQLEQAYLLGKTLAE